jgi:hypothetical protein
MFDLPHPEALKTVSGGRDVPGHPRGGLRRAAAGCVWLLALTAGCVTTGSPTASRQDAPQTGVACEVAAVWDPKVLFAPDPLHGGAKTPALSGRLYLFGAQSGFPLAGDGVVTIELYDDRPTLSGGQPVMLEQWNLDKETLKSLFKHDAIGWGYTLFVPWGTYKPEINLVHLHVCYRPPTGMPLYAPSEPMTLDTGGPLAPVAGKQVPPVANRPPNKPRG